MLVANLFAIAVHLNFWSNMRPRYVMCFVVAVSTPRVQLVVSKVLDQNQIVQFLLIKELRRSVMRFRALLFYRFSIF